MNPDLLLRIYAGIHKHKKKPMPIRINEQIHRSNLKSQLRKEARHWSSYIWLGRFADVAIKKIRTLYDLVFRIHIYKRIEMLVQPTRRLY